jgi:hypothetical protein
MHPHDLLSLQDTHEMPDFLDHTARDRRIRLLDDLVHATQAQGADGRALALR